MTLKKALSVLLSLLIMSVMPVIAVSAENQMPLDTSYTGYDEEPAIVYDDDLSYDFSLDIASVIVSFELEKYNQEQGFALKMVVNDMTDSNDYYFLTLSTNEWATVDSGYGVVNDPIEPIGEGSYNIKFDVSELGEMNNIKFNLWQGTAKIYGVAYLDKDGNLLNKTGEIKSADRGCFVPGKGKVADFNIVEYEEPATQSQTETVTINTQSSTSAKTESIMSGRMPWLFNFLSAQIFGIRIVWILVVLFLLLGAGFMTAAILLTGKRRRDINSKKNEDKSNVKKSAQNKQRAPRDIEKRG